jgi:hypothetical protein
MGLAGARAPGSRAAAVLRRSEHTALFVCERRRSRRAPKRDPRERSEQSNSEGGWLPHAIGGTARQSVRVVHAVQHVGVLLLHGPAPDL